MSPTFLSFEGGMHISAGVTIFEWTTHHPVLFLQMTHIPPDSHFALLSEYGTGLSEFLMQLMKKCADTVIIDKAME